MRNEFAEFCGSTVDGVGSGFESDFFSICNSSVRTIEIDDLRLFDLV